VCSSDLDRRARLGLGTELGAEILHVGAVIGDRARDPRDDPRLVHAGDAAFEEAPRRFFGRRRVAVEGPEEDGEPLLPFEALAGRGEPPLDVGALPREQQQDRELGAEDRHARVLEVAVALVDELGQVGDDAGPIAADGRQREELLHETVLSVSGIADTTSAKIRCQLRTAPRLRSVPSRPMSARPRKTGCAGAWKMRWANASSVTCM